MNHSFRYLLKVLFVNLFVFIGILQITSQNQSIGIVWPEGQAIPHFAQPSETLDGFSIAGKILPDSEKILFAALQGLVNKSKPRIYLYGEDREGKHKWPDNLGLKIEEYAFEKRWELIKKYQQEITGLILYSTEKSEHYKNLATTVSGIKNALPITKAEQEQLNQAGVQLPILVDMTSLPYATPVEIYTYLYDTYWKDCTKRLLVSLNTRVPVNIRDIGVAAECAILWLEPRKEEENKVLRKFLGDMKPGESIIIGWWTEERAGIGIGTEFGISTIPADFYDNASVHAGLSHNMRMPVVPKKPELENKIYMTVYLSDGDNVQYCQHAMSTLWDNKNRGIIPINWTVSPGLVDIGPGILNYYYDTATPNDFFASGPSGLGYALIYDAHNKKWNTTEKKDLDPYTRFTQEYLEKSGLRVITLWDEINEDQMESFVKNCRYLYGATQQDWEKREKLFTITKHDKLAFIPNYPCYANGIDVIFNMNKKSIEEFDGTKPLFLTAQGESWKMGPENIVLLKEKVESIAPGNVVICRGDHFFALYNEAHKLDFNLTLSAKMKITSSPTSSQPEYAADGTCSNERKWVSSANGDKWILFDFKENYQLNRYVVRHAGYDGMDASLNTRSFRLETSKDGKKWVVADSVENNTANVTDKDFPSVEARYVRLTITHPGMDGTARIGDVEIYGRKL